MYTLFPRFSAAPISSADSRRLFGKWKKSCISAKLWKRFEEEGVKGGHGGMDWLIFDAYFGALHEGVVPPIDTYDTAAWMSITPLSEASIAMGGAPQEIPDFTRGKWMNRDRVNDQNHGFYALDK